MLRDRYGWCSLPYEIPIEEFSVIEGYITDENERKLLSNWYKRDDNAVPPVYCLNSQGGLKIAAGDSGGRFYLLSLKSFDIGAPVVTPEYVFRFFSGCWDGGSVKAVLNGKFKLVHYII